MSLQDDVFDVTAFLEENGDEATQKQFDRIVTALWRYEHLNEQSESVLNRIRDGLQAASGLLDTSGR